ncbi:uncharacterized protein KZ484_004040 [Pholidichthys leucotaenia]
MNMFRRDKSPRRHAPVVPPRPTKEELDKPTRHSLKSPDASQESDTDVTSELNPESKRTGVMGVMQKVNPFKSSTPKHSMRVSQASSSESLEQSSDAEQRTGVMGVMHKVNPFKSSAPKKPSTTVSQASSSESLEQTSNSEQVSKASSSESLEQGMASDSPQTHGVFKGMMQKVNPFKSTAKVPKSDPQEHSSNAEETVKDLQDKQNPGMISGMMQKVNPFKSSQPKETKPINDDLSSSSASLAENNSLPAKQHPGMFRGMMKKVNPFRSYKRMEDECQTDSAGPPQDQAIQSENSTSSESLDESTVDRHSIWYVDADTGYEIKNQPTAAPKKTKIFTLRRILPRGLFGSGAKDPTNASSDTETTSQEVVEVQTLQLAEIPVPSEGTGVDPIDDEDGLLEWWRTVEGWDEWTETNQNEEEGEVVEEAADRVFMAARLFVRFFNQRGASLQQRILELLTLADSADHFHKKTVTASVGGGVASVAGSITTITGLILAPFTAGTSLIVTAVGIGIATAGGVTSASANITDTVHSKTDRKKVEKMIQDYQEEISDIKDCLEFLQQGMETLEEWNFEKYAESISKKHLNQNVKHVMKEGGRAGKALVINTDSLINTVQVLNVAGGAAKAAQVMSVTTGVMSGLFLALDVFFLAKDSIELKKGAKTDFAVKIREVCKELQDGLLELNRIKEELQATMDGIEVSIEEEEEEEEEEDEEKLKLELKKLYDLDK